ncbi:FMN-dependent NADH-azoreductase [Spiribacter halobius]|uniref:FMN-dependent NADH-azoreductase n=1 Tax=Sediminicurvatus halobius TaxID=2182432 RepID=UPI0018EEBD3C
MGREPPAIISERWIAAAFEQKGRRTAEQVEVLKQSDTLIDEIRRADVLLIATPNYNYGMPAALKAWVDQVIRVEETFSFDLARGDQPLEPILSGRTMVILSSSGEFGYAPGGPNAEHNHLEPHLRSAGRLFGVSSTFHIAIEYEEFGGERHALSKAEAHRRARELARQLASTSVDHCAEQA